ncbi:tripartite tricarboxylate transporter TctB family protein [Rhodoferax mekongensis]|uniref:tripartite tricarboxylate transporter TctB family protein n=1 Tax=Rhodoferax mekongensis TaxID=3068341 RepID=UPI0028BE7CE4|nr:tripartite tricarboxylate transporter TctB family protein [Rhodoferax sp. TBRC 17199]MDT7515201.1 tripartite tricarboxylate transporter TctB family protein [Rhodoferax sp. TBRC 17199]NBX20963.1 tripartite tricarboxylate transporter TctB family protein [Betaproteobacteria bacterium]
MTHTLKARQEAAVAIGVLLLALGLGAGAWIIPSEAGYAGVGPDFLPWVVSVSLLLCGAFLLWEVRTGGFRDLEEGDDGEQPYWPGFVWMSVGLLVNAALITTIGFIFSCALCFVLAARGARLSQGQAAGGARTWVLDSVVGLLIAAPVYWMFTKFLAIGLPGLTQSGWL